MSRTLTYILRHGAKKEGVEITADGYVSMKNLLRFPNLSHLKQEEVLEIVRTCPKQRFHAEQRGGGEWWLRANQGHSFSSSEVKLNLTPLTDPLLYPFAVHGTYKQHWNSIKLSGLSRMSRQHIHIAIGEYGDGQVISGMRSTSQLLIYINLAKAMLDGIEFYVSDNDVILTEGVNGGYLPPQYFIKVVDAQSGRLVTLDDSFPSHPHNNNNNNNNNRSYNHRGNNNRNYNNRNNNNSNY